MKKNTLLATIVTVVVLGFGFILFGTSQASAQTAPDFELKDINGNAVNLSDYKGKVIILDVWATWCPPCKAEIPSFIELQDEFADDIVVIGVSLDQAGPQAVEPFAKEWGINYPVLYGFGSSVPQLYGGVQGIPTTFVIDRDFKLQRKYVGYTDHEVFEADILEFI